MSTYQYISMTMNSVFRIHPRHSLACSGESCLKRGSFLNFQYELVTDEGFLNELQGSLRNYSYFFNLYFLYCIFNFIAKSDNIDTAKNIIFNRPSKHPPRQKKKRKKVVAWCCMWMTGLAESPQVYKLITEDLTSTASILCRLLGRT